MDFLHRDELAFFEAHLTERMLRYILGSDSLPRSPVLLIDIRLTLILIIFTPLGYTVFFTILTVCQIGTPRIRAWSFRLARHHHTSFECEKPSQERSREGFGLFYLADYIIS